jgi:hypothetical protein
LALHLGECQLFYLFVTRILTTSSGVAYCDISNGHAQANDIQLVTEWPGMGSGNTEKVPSRISYGPPPDVKIKWGNLIKPKDESPVHALMKLRLDERLKKSKQLKLLLAFLSSNFDSLDLDDVDSDDEEEDGPPEYPGKPVVDIVADYLTVSSPRRSRKIGVPMIHYCATGSPQPRLGHT